MSGRRRRDDEWDGGHRDAQDDGRDPWADSSVGEWGDRDHDRGDDADWSATPAAGDAAGAHASRGAATGYGGGSEATKGKNAAPSFPSFQIGSDGAKGRSSGRTQGGAYDSAEYGDGYGADAGYGGQRGAATARGSAGYNGDGRRDGGYADGGYDAGRPAEGGYRQAGHGQDAGDPRDSYGGGRREAGRDAAYGGEGGAGGYGAPGYSAPGYGAGGYGNDPGYGGAAGYGTNGRAVGTVQVPGFTPSDNDDSDDDSAAPGTPRPMGRLSIYTLQEDKAKEFDRIAERAAEGVRTAEPDTLVFVIHVVPKAPMQRIIYEIYRDRAAFLSHERQPHIRQFAADRASCVLATNIIDLRLKYAKVAALGTPAVAASPPQASWTPRAAESPAAGDRPQGGAQYQPAQYQGGQEPRTAAAASFTPAKDRYPAEDRQYAATGREHYPTQFENSGNGAYDAAGNGQYGAANSYSGAAGYANGGSYPSANGYPAANGYPGDNGYQGANGYPGNNGYQDANGYPNANGYANGSGYSGVSGYQGDGAYPNGGAYAAGGGTYANGSDPANAAGGQYGAAEGYGDTAAAPDSAQYAPRYRELTSGTTSDESGNRYRDNGARYGDGGRASARASDWDARPKDQR